MAFSGEEFHKACGFFSTWITNEKNVGSRENWTSQKKQAESCQEIKFFIEVNGD
jgi:hypothetical protein